VQPPPRSTHRRTLFLLGLIAIALPFLCVTLPPSADLPQHVAQARLLHEVVGTEGSPYEVRIITPYWTAYVLLSALWAVLPPLQVGRVGLLLVGFASVGMLYLLARQRGRSPEAAVLAGLLFFNHTLYWGYLSFMAGWPVFLGLLLLLGAGRPAGLARVLALAGLLALLFWTHALWLIAGLAAFGLSWLVRRPSSRMLVWEALAPLPTLAVALWWYPRMAEKGFTSKTHYVRDAIERLSFPGLREAVLGGLYSPIEDVLLALLLLWMGVGLWQHRRAPRTEGDGLLALVGTVLLLANLTLPDKHSLTLAFSSRWAPFGFALLLLAVPAPRLPGRTLAAATGVLVLGYGGFTAANWYAFETTELSGLRMAIEALPPSPRVLGLDLLKKSAWVRGRSFLQTFAYAQVLRGGSLNFSFADHAPVPVSYQPPRHRPWMNGLEWYAEEVVPADTEAFDYVLVGGTALVHEKIPGGLPVEPVTHEGLWRLYRVVHATPGQR
jgi:hypothetical protein